ncbi:MAG: DAK2 domain-containing protein [Halanaerobiales bacterium]|nr:DAK2 domain-containing protein [Halanaerobiales bacterium]
MINIDAKDFKRMILAGTCWLNEHKDYVDSLNVFPVPDGDTGTNMYLTVLNAAKEVQNCIAESVSEIAEALQEGALMGARGNSGVILSQLFRGMSRSLKNKNTMNANDLAIALNSASEMAYKAVMRPVEGTILTVARYMGQGALESAMENEDVIKVLEDAIAKGNEALQMTPELLPVLKEANVVDAGGQGYLFFIEGALRVLKGLSVEDALTVYDNQKFEKKSPSATPPSTMDIEFQYCTEFLIMSGEVPIDQVRNHLERMGDSLLVVGAKGATKVHVHTNNPGKVLDYALKFGSLNKIKIDNMVEQSHRHLDEVEEKIKTKEKKTFGIVAVTAGEGLSEIIESLGVDEVVMGGQSMNPSTQDLVDAVEKINSDHIIILPNNKNIIFAAEQVKNISRKEVSVIPTRSIPQGICALMSINPEQQFGEIVDGMINSVNDVKTGEITIAVRDSKVNSIEIGEGDCLGLMDGTISVVGSDFESTSLELLSKMVTEDSFLITIYYGSDVSEERAETLLAKVEDQFSDQDIELYYGGQPLYDFIFSVE